MQRRIFEARARLREGYTNREKVDELMRLVASRRGHAAAERLRADMREQWKIRSQWMI